MSSCSLFQNQNEIECMLSSVLKMVKVPYSSLLWIHGIIDFLFSIFGQKGKCNGCVQEVWG